VKKNLTVFLFIVSGLVWLYFSLFHCFDDDEFQHCHNAYLIWKGLVPYRDFFEHHIPLYHILFSALFAFDAGRWTIFLFRIASVIASAGVFVLIGKYLKKTYDSATAIISLTLLACVPMFLIKMTEARPESIAVFVFALTMIFVFSHHFDRNVFFTGILSGLMVCFSQKYFFVYIGILVACFIMHGRKQTVFFIAGSFSMFFVLILYLVSKGILPDFINSTLLMNIKWKYRFSPAGYFYQAFQTAGFLIACGIAGIIGEFFISGNKKKAMSLFSIMIGCLLAIVIVPVPYRQVFLPFFVVLTIAGGWFFYHFLQVFQSQKLKIIAATIVVVCAVSGAIPIISQQATQKNSPDLCTMKKADEISPGTPFFDGRCLLFYRMHTGYFGFMHHELLEMIDLQEYSVQTIEAIKENHYPVVIYDYRVKQMPDEIQNFIQKHYCSTGFGDIYMPGITIDRAEFIDGKANFEINVSGWYKIKLEGEHLLIDGKTVSDRDIIFLQRGNHTAEITGFIEYLTAILEKRL